MAAMDRTRIAKVEDVSLARRGEQVSGTLHLTPHHLIFVHTPPSVSPSPSGPSSQDSATKQPPSQENTTKQQHSPPPAAPPTRPRELWITYPIIAFCTLRTLPAASRQPSSIRLRCRDFTFVCFYFASDTKARDVYDSIRAWTTKLGRIEKLYAFAYQPPPPERDVNYWGIYDPMKEWRRMGVGVDKGDGKRCAWRISRINADYGFSPTYPSLLAVPSAISDNTLNYAGRYRSRQRIPALTYLHPVNNCSITRCSQPMVGVRGNRSIQDEKLLAAIFDTTRAERPLSAFVASPPPEREEPSGSGKESTVGEMANSLDADLHQTSTEAIEDAVISKLRADDDEAATDREERGPMVYGAQQRNMIVDARPTVNAYAMQAVGLGSENMDNYKFATKVYLGIDNIHVMRDSLQKVVDSLKDSDVTPLGPNREALHKSGWLKHIGNLLEGVGLIARQVGLQHSHVLIHCSDGWDRTSQLSSLSQICLDPYYRTMEGFIVLVEKDWLSFGHMFRHRSGFLSSEKWFQIENERIGGGGPGAREGGADSSTGADAVVGGAQKTFENALLSAKGFFSNKHHNDSRESLNIDSDGDQLQSYDSDSQGRRRVPGTTTDPPPSKPKHAASGSSNKPETKVKETAPIFHQFLDATYQLLHQYPTRFEFSERFLRRLLYHLYSCQYGTFLYDSEKERGESRVREKTRCVWDYFLSRKEQFLNPEYDGGVVDDNVRGRERLIFPLAEEVRWWSGAFGRADEEMNSPVPVPVVSAVSAVTAAAVAGGGGPAAAGTVGPTIVTKGSNSLKVIGGGVGQVNGTSTPSSDSAAVWVHSRPGSQVHSQSGSRTHSPSPNEDAGVGVRTGKSMAKAMETAMSTNVTKSRSRSRTPVLTGVETSEEAAAGVDGSLEMTRRKLDEASMSNELGKSNAGSKPTLKLAEPLESSSTSKEPQQQQSDTAMTTTQHPSEEGGDQAVRLPLLDGHHETAAKAPRIDVGYSPSDVEGLQQGQRHLQEGHQQQPQPQPQLQQQPQPELQQQPHLNQQRQPRQEEHQHHQLLASNLDPLGIGDVKDHVPSTNTISSSRVRTAQARQRARELLDVELMEV